MDTVWIRLNSIVNIKDINIAVDDIQESYFMFGPTGIVRFERSYVSPGVTLLFNSTKTVVAEVIEDPESILEILRTIRKTGRANEQITKKKISSKKKRGK